MRQSASSPHSEVPFTQPQTIAELIDWAFHYPWDEIEEGGDE